MNYFLPTGSFFIQTAPESYRLFRTYHKGTGKPVRPTTTDGVGNGWSPSNTDGAIWMCEKSAMTINEGTWGDVIRIKGEVGMPGPMGKPGKLLYPAGPWDDTTSYKCDEKKAQFIYYEAGKTYYVLNKEGSFKGINPATDYAANGLNATWIPLETFKAVYAEILFARFGLLGKAVFYNEFMFSQYGRNKKGELTTEYGKYGTDDFTPRLEINLLTGDIFCESLTQRSKKYNKLTKAEHYVYEGGSSIMNWGMPYLNETELSNYIYNDRSGAVWAGITPITVLNPDWTSYKPNQDGEFMLVQKFGGNINTDIITVSAVGQIRIMVRGILCNSLELYLATYVKFIYKEVPEDDGNIYYLVLNSGDFDIVNDGLSKKAVSKHR